MKTYFVYILASSRNGTLYTGMTSNLVKRIFEHKTKAVQGFTAKYSADQLVYYEVHQDVHEALKREKNIQAWKRQWKLNLIEKQNPTWIDLFGEISGCQPTLS